MTTILSIIITLGIIIFVHELGHFLAAKLMGVRVEQFSLGFPPKMISKKVGETEYMLSWIPLGGYVKMAGMVDESLDDKPLTGAPWEFMSKKYPQKLFVITAGVMMNFILAFLIYTIITLWVGIGEIGPAKVGSVEPGTPADSIGLIPGDLIVNIDGDSIPNWESLSGYIHDRPGEEVFISWMRDGETFSSLVIPQEYEGISNGEKVKIGLIGIGPELVRRPAGFIEAIINGAESTYYACSATVMGLYMLVTGEAGIKDFTGPVGIAEFTGRAMRSGALVFFSVIAFISANIGLLNILPIPVLDGGHVIFISIEAIIRKQISTKVKLIIQQVGMALLLVLILIISYNDIMRLFVQK